MFPLLGTISGPVLDNNQCPAQCRGLFAPLRPANQRPVTAAVSNTERTGGSGLDLAGLPNRTGSTELNQAGLDWIKLDYAGVNSAGLWWTE